MNSRAKSQSASLAETLLWLLRVPSHTGDERGIADALEARLQHAPIAQRVRRYGHSLVVPWTRVPGAPHVLLCGHTDTVRTENGTPRIEGDRIYGSGSSDMKSGLALMFELITACTPHVSVSLVFYASEEGPFVANELGRVLAEDAEVASADYAVCLEPSDNVLQLGCCGSLHATVQFSGRTGHSARPWEAESAVLKAAPLLARLAALAPIEHVVDGLTFRTVTSVTRANDGGRGRNVVPDSFTLNLNHRFAPGTSIEQACADVEALVAGEGSVQFTDKSPSAMPHAAHPFTQALVAAGAKGVERKQAWTDVARFGLAGIAAVNFGPGINAQAHQANEFTSLALLVDGFDIFRNWLAALPKSTHGQI